jgi:transposase
MWTPTTRQQHSRTVTRYQTDLTDAEWLVIAPYLPKPCATADARDHQWHLLCNAGGLPVAAAADRLAAMGDDLPLVRRLARR